MSSDEEIDNSDYEGLQWIDDEAFYRGKKQKRKLSKEDHIYGIFREDLPEREDETKRRNRPSSEPLSFVSSGKMEEKVTEKVEISMPKPKETPPPRKPVESEESTLPTSFGQKIKEGAAKRQREEEEKEKVKKAWKKANSTGFAAFEQHSRGIASKLMQKMGYKPGEGLGVRKQGVVEPVVEQMRPKSMGMGYGDFKEHTGGLDTVDIVDRMPEDQPERSKEQPRLWSTSTAKQRRKRRYKTADDVLKESESTWKEAAMPAILDMRGPKTKLLTDISKISEDIQETQRPLPELQSNMDLLVEMTENEIKNLDLRKKTEEDLVVLMGREEERLLAEQTTIAAQLRRLLELRQQLESSVLCLDVQSDIELFYSEVIKVKEEFTEEYFKHNVPRIVLAKVSVWFANLYSNWDPLKDSDRGLDQLSRWKEVLASSGNLKDDAFGLLCVHTIVPSLRRAVVNQWNPRQPHDLVDFFEAWNGILPDDLVKYACHNLVFPKIKASVESWEPRKDTMPLHAWIHPWLPLMHLKLRQIYAIIISKLVNALKNWKISDLSAVTLLSPWKTVFSQSQWESLLTKAILPKLAEAVQNYEINPLNHDLVPLQKFCKWFDLIPKESLVSILDLFFFPRWIEVLHMWLSNDGDLSEISTWYLSWKAIFPSEVLEDFEIKVYFEKALDLMNRATERMPMPSMESVLRRSRAKRPIKKPVPQKTVITLRDMVQSFAEENNVSFVPKLDRTHEGLQVYSFDGVSVVLDNSQNKLRAQFGQNWRPVSLEQLFVEARARK